MDFIERCFNFSPDSGNGTFETLLLMVILIGAWFYLRRRKGP